MISATREWRFFFFSQSPASKADASLILKQIIKVGEKISYSMDAGHSQECI